LKRITELRDLSDDHHTTLVLARRCRESADPGAPVRVRVAWHQVREVFASHLEPHFEIEERHLLPALETIGEAVLADRIRDDHASLRALVKRASPGPAEVGRFGRLLESHVRFEEREVFEVVQSRLPATTLRAIAEACRSTPRGCPTFLQT
jgi:hypothetical protein